MMRGSGSVLGVLGRGGGLQFKAHSADDINLGSC